VPVCTTYDYNPEGKWSVESVVQRYEELKQKLGSIDGFELKPKSYTNYNGATWIYNIMNSAVYGMQRGASPVPSSAYNILKTM
jgi:hypothetical protein